MVDSPMYDRLMRLVAALESAEALVASDGEHNAIVCGLNEANNSTYHLRANQGFTGETGNEIDAWADATMKRVQGIKESHNSAMEYYVEARRAMKHICEEAQQLSPNLIDASLQQLADAAHVVVPVTKYLGPLGQPINALAVSADAYFQALITQANDRREVNSTDILERANNTMQELANGVNIRADDLENLGNGLGIRNQPGPSSPSVRRDIENGYLNVSRHKPGVYPGNRDNDYGRSDLRGPGSGLYPDGYDEGGPVSDRVMSSPRIPNRFTEEGEAGSRSNPITDPDDLRGIDLLHTRVNGDRHANGTIGGYTPAPPTDRHHPLWKVNGGSGDVSSISARLGGAGLLAAGGLGVGAAARFASMSSGKAITGTTSLRPGAYSGMGSGSFAARGATLPSAGTSGASVNRGGTTGQGGYMGGAGGSGAATKDEKKGRRRKYTPFRVDDDDELPEGYVNPLSQTYGSEKDIEPVSRKNDGWDIRQW